MAKAKKQIYSVTVRVFDRYQPKQFWEDRTISLEAADQDEAECKAIRVAVQITSLAVPGWGRVLEVTC